MSSAAYICAFAMFFSLSNSVSFVFAVPHGSFSLSLGSLSINVLAGRNFLFKLFLHTIKLVLQVLESSKKELTLSGFVVSIMLNFFKSSLKALLHLLNHVDIVVDVTSGPEKISILSSQPPLLRLKVSKSHVSFFNLLAEVIKLTTQVLIGLL